MKNFRYNLPLSVFLLMLIALPLYASIPGQINFQGILKDASGRAITDSSLSVVFSIYSGATGGSLLWTETQTVTVESGLYSVRLGSVNAIGSSVFDGTTRYLGIKVGTDAEMTPRVALVTVPYSYRSGMADSVAASSGAVMLGPAVTQETTGKYGIDVASTVSGGIGIYGKGSLAGVSGEATGGNGCGVYGSNDIGYGVYGSSSAGSGVFGRSSNGHGVYGLCDNGYAIFGTSSNGSGVVGNSTNQIGVMGFSLNNYSADFYGGHGVWIEPVTRQTSGTDEGVVAVQNHHAYIYLNGNWKQLDN